VVQSAELTRPFDCADVGRFFDCTDHRRVSPGIAAYRADLFFGEIEAVRAGAHTLGKRDERIGKPTALLSGLFKQMIREAQRRLSADAGKSGKLCRQRVDCGHARTAA